MHLLSQAALALSALALMVLLALLVRRRRTDPVNDLLAGLRGGPVPPLPRGVAPSPPPAGPEADRRSGTGHGTGRRSPYATRATPERIVLPDDDAELAIEWRADPPPYGIPGLSPTPDDARS